MLERRGYANRSAAAQHLRRTTPRRTLSPKQLSASRSQDPFKLERVSEARIGQLRQWLRSLGFEAFASAENAELLQNPFRNGVLLCELAALWEGSTLGGVHFVPRTASEARSNVSLALRSLGRVCGREGAPLLHYSYLRLEEPLLRGERRAIWGILDVLEKAAPSHLRGAGLWRDPSVGAHLPYSAEDVERLEDSLVAWLQTHFIGQVPQGTRLVDLEEVIRSGEIFVRVVEGVLGVRIAGVTVQPRTLASCVSNMRKALEPLRQQPAMSKRFLWSERAIVGRMERGAMLGLLEDLHRFHDGLPARPTGEAYFADGPYLGSKAHPPRHPRCPPHTHPHQAAAGSAIPQQLEIETELVPVMGQPHSARNQPSRNSHYLDSQHPRHGFLNNTVSPSSLQQRHEMPLPAVNPFVPRVAQDIEPGKQQTAVFPSARQLVRELPAKASPQRETTEEYFHPERAGCSGAE